MRPQILTNMAKRPSEIQQQSTQIKVTKLNGFYFKVARLGKSANVSRLFDSRLASPIVEGGVGEGRPPSVLDAPLQRHCGGGGLHTAQRRGGGGGCGGGREGVNISIPKSINIYFRS